MSDFSYVENSELADCLTGFARSRETGSEFAHAVVFGRIVSSTSEL